MEGLGKWFRRRQLRLERQTEEARKWVVGPGLAASFMVAFSLLTGAMLIIAVTFLCRPAGR